MLMLFFSLFNRENYISACLTERLKTTKTAFKFMMKVHLTSIFKVSKVYLTVKITLVRV